MKQDKRLQHVGLRVAPRGGAWIETSTMPPSTCGRWKSHPAWVRGLKRQRREPGQPRTPSHPAWVRGLKHHLPHEQQGQGHVAPRVGAWIETIVNTLYLSWIIVAPRVGAWIETKHFRLIIRQHVVAPRVGAWIETILARIQRQADRVAPRVGAWIETNNGSDKNCIFESHPAWVRGLKPCIRNILINCLWCRTPRGCVD